MWKRRTISTFPLLLLSLGTVALTCPGVSSPLSAQKPGTVDRIVPRNHLPIGSAFTIDGPDHVPNDEVHILDIPGTFSIENYKGGSGEVVVYPAGDRSIRVHPVDWTRGEDRVVVGGDPIVEITISFWIAYDPDESWIVDAYNSVLVANAIFAFENAGVRLVDVEVERSVLPEESWMLEYDSEEPHDLANSIAEVVGHSPGRLNVYVVRTVDTSPTRGHVYEISKDKLFLGYQGSLSLLAHEVGHQLALFHPTAYNEGSSYTNHESDLFTFNDSSLMVASSSQRRYLTEGEIARAHLRVKSGANRTYAEGVPPWRSYTWSGTPTTRSMESYLTTPLFPAVDFQIFENVPYDPAVALFPPPSTRALLDARRLVDALPAVRSPDLCSVRPDLCSSMSDPLTETNAITPHSR